MTKTVLPHTASDFSVEDEMKPVRSFQIVAKDEFERLVNADNSALEDALKRGRQDAIAAEKEFNPPANSNIRFR